MSRSAIELAQHAFEDLPLEPGDPPEIDERFALEAGDALAELRAPDPTAKWGRAAELRSPSRVEVDLVPEELRDGAIWARVEGAIEERR